MPSSPSEMGCKRKKSDPTSPPHRHTASGVPRFRRPALHWARSGPEFLYARGVYSTGTARAAGLWSLSGSVPSRYLGKASPEKSGNPSRHGRATFTINAKRLGIRSQGRKPRRPFYGASTSAHVRSEKSTNVQLPSPLPSLSLFQTAASVTPSSTLGKTGASPPRRTSFPRSACRKSAGTRRGRGRAPAGGSCESPRLATVGRRRTSTCSFA